MLVDADAMRELEELGLLSTPVTAIDDEVVVGFNRGRLDELLGQPERSVRARGAVEERSAPRCHATLH